MVDGLNNNRKKRKKGKKRKSVLKRLHEKQLEVARREKKIPQQNLPQVMQTSSLLHSGIIVERLLLRMICFIFIFVQRLKVPVSRSILLL